MFTSPDNIHGIVYESLADVPPDVLSQLKRTGYHYSVGFMRSIIADFFAGKTTQRTHYVTIAYVGDAVACWAVIDDLGFAHVWTLRKYRKRGLAPLTLSFLLRVLPRSKAKTLQMRDRDTAGSLLTIARYLAHNVNNLHKIVFCSNTHSENADRRAA